MSMVLDLLKKREIAVNRLYELVMQKYDLLKEETSYNEAEISFYEHMYEMLIILSQQAITYRHFAQNRSPDESLACMWDEPDYVKEV